jgi:2-polyprenyl-3-methyl-5-hydroxy-6-metoxy-1,4-benzoquinol methylase
MKWPHFFVPTGWDAWWRVRDTKSYLPIVDAAYAARARYILQHATPLVRSSSLRILELGSGEGRVVKHLLLQAPQARATLVDWSPAAVGRARHVLGEVLSRADFAVGNANEPGAFRDLKPDIVLSLGVVEHYPDPSPIVRDMAAMMPSGSVLVLMTPSRRSFVRLSRIILQVTGKWHMGYQEECSTRQLAKFCRDAGLEVHRIEAAQRSYFHIDTWLTKICAFADRVVIAIGVRDWGWYSWVFARKP